MKNLSLVVLTLATLAFGGYTGYTVYDQEARISRLRDAEYNLGVLSTALKAAQPTLELATKLASENSDLIARERAAAATVDGYLVENKKLKESLREAVENLETLTQENNSLLSDVDKLQFKIDALEKSLNVALQTIEQMRKDLTLPAPPTQPVQPVEPPANKLPF